MDILFVAVIAIAGIVIANSLINVINKNKHCFFCFCSKQCTNCIFCFFCRNCSNCKSDFNCLFCKRSKNCTNCKSCNFCFDCVHCISCMHCINCVSCKFLTSKDNIINDVNTFQQRTLFLLPYIPSCLIFVLLYILI